MQVRARVRVGRGVGKSWRNAESEFATRAGDAAGSSPTHVCVRAWVQLHFREAAAGRKGGEAATPARVDRMALALASPAHARARIFARKPTLHPQLH